MKSEIIEVTLVSGEMVRIVHDLAYGNLPRQAYVRFGKRLIAGVVNDLHAQCIYIWHETGDVYQYMGHLTFENLKNGSVMLEAYMSVDPADLADLARKEKLIASALKN